MGTLAALVVCVGLPAGAGPGPFNVTGAVLLGVSAYNPSYGAQPDNSGLALMRYAAHLDVELLGRHLVVPLDVTVFSDGTARGLRKYAPSELDVMGGLLTAWDLPADLGTAEVSTRWEHDRPVGNPGFTQTYVDVRGAHYWSLGALLPHLSTLLLHGDVSGWGTVGAFVMNPSYAARPDNTGLALFRLNPHAELSVLGDAFSVGADATVFTDRRAPNPLRPSEADLTVETIFRTETLELHFAYEEDRPLDRSGLTQRFVYALMVVGFDLSATHAPFRPVPFEQRNRILSP